MAVQLHPTCRENPFADVASHSLLHQTLGPATAAAAPEAALQILFQTMAVKGSTKLFEDAQTITTSYSSNQDLYAKADDKAPVTNVEDNPQGRRPALGRKKARFSVKPKQCDSSANCGVYDIVEPQEYFSAVDQIQRGEEEMKKCTGAFASDLAQLHPSPTVRNRRLGLLGRTASYKHHLSDDADATKAFKMSQEDIPGQIIPSPAKTPDSKPSNIRHPETTEKGFSHSMGPKSELLDETRGEVFVSEKEKSVDDLLENMFTSFKASNGDTGVKLLQEKLRIKSRDPGKTSFPEPDGFQRTDLRIPKTTTRKRLDRSLPEPISSTTTTIPLAVIANLQRRISLKDPLSDPIAMSLSDDEPYPGETMGDNVRRLSSSADTTEGVTNDICTDGASTPENVSGKRMSLVEETHLSVRDASRAVSNKIASDEDSVEEAPELYRYSADLIRFSNLETVVDAGHVGHSAKEANGLQTSTSICCQPDTVVKDLTTEFMNHNDMEPLATPPNRNMVGNNDERINGSGSSLVCDATVQEEATIPNCVQSDTVVEDLSTEFTNHNDMEPLSNMSGNISKGINESASSVGGDTTVQEEVNVTSGRKSLSRAKESKESSRRVSRRKVVQNISGSENGGKSSFGRDTILQDSTMVKKSSRRVSRRKVVQNISGSGNGGKSSFGRDTILQDKVNVMVQGEPVLQAEVSRALASPQKTFLPRNGHTETVAGLPEETTEVGLAVNMASLPEGTNETHVSQEISGVSPVRARKRKAPISGQNKKKPTSNRQSVPRRQSLADCGLTWKSGRRQSTRIKFKPLQHWCGERVLYGRIHDSVMSVIGVKVVSPRADGKSPMLKVKSYVSEEYDELIAIIADKSLDERLRS